MNNRRHFLKTAAIATVAAVALPTTFLSASKAKANNERNEFVGVANRTDLRSSAYGNKYIIVRGKVYDKMGFAPHPRATVELSNSANNLFLSGKKTKVVTNEKGEYEFWVDVPERILGKAPRLNFNVASENKAYLTELIITDFDAHISGKHWERNQQLGDKLFPIKEDFSDHAVVSFNLSV